MAKGTKAVAYLRTSSAANVGADKDSDKRQRDAIMAFAKRAGFLIVAELYDPAVSGADPIETRPGFAALLDRIESNGVRTVVVEDASRFARDLITQELGILALIGRGVRVLTASGDDLTATDDAFKVACARSRARLPSLRRPGSWASSRLPVTASVRPVRRWRAGSPMPSFGPTWWLWRSGCTGPRPRRAGGAACGGSRRSWRKQGT